jgi:hypothetical protein
VAEVCSDIGYGCGGGREKVCGELSVSSFNIRSNELGRSHGGGTIFARRWRLSKRASQSGRGERWGGRSAGVAPWDISSDRMRRKVQLMLLRLETEQWWGWRGQNLRQVNSDSRDAGVGLQ